MQLFSSPFFGHRAPSAPRLKPDALWWCASSAVRVMPDPFFEPSPKQARFVVQGEVGSKVQNPLESR